MLANDAATQSDVENQLNINTSTQTSEQATSNTKPNEANPEITDITLSFQLSVVGRQRSVKLLM
jgi:hypothetical protein